MLAEFDLLTPTSLPEALQMLAERGPSTIPLAGGTNVVVDLRAGRDCPEVVLDLRRLDGLRGVRHEDGHIVVGARTTIGDLLVDPLVARYGAVLRDAAAVFANPLVRNRATVGGNIADASPAADTAPALLALDAVVDLASVDGTRCLPLQDFFVGVRQTRRRPDELITAVRWPVPAEPAAGGFRKLGLRRADAIAVITVAVIVRSDGSGTCRHARIALGAVAPTPLRAYAAEAALGGRLLTPDVIQEAARLAAEAASPISDVRGSSGYRTRVVNVLTRRLLTDAQERLAASSASESGADTGRG